MFRTCCRRATTQCRRATPLYGMLLLVLTVPSRVANAQLQAGYRRPWWNDHEIGVCNLQGHALSCPETVTQSRETLFKCRIAHETDRRSHRVCRLRRVVHRPNISRCSRRYTAARHQAVTEGRCGYVLLFRPLSRPERGHGVVSRPFSAGLTVLGQRRLLGRSGTRVQQTPGNYNP